ncbi:thioredoxin, partial [Burkholderia glumae]|nr:thioredoxin [Burkholderia glumae]
KQADPNTPMWPEKVTGALAYVAGSSDPDECAVALGMPTDVLDTVASLSTYRSTHLSGARFVADWLESVPVGADLSALPGRLLNEILASPLVSDTLDGDAALLAIRDELAALHAAEAGGAQLPEEKWAAVAQAAREVAAAPAEGNRTRAAAVLVAASSSLARNPDMLKDFVSVLCRFVQECLKAKCHWGAEDESRLFKLMDGIFKHALDTGAEPPRGPAMMKHVAEIDPRLAERFLFQYEEGDRASRERGGAIGDMLISLTRRCA